MHEGYNFVWMEIIDISLIGPYFLSNVLYGEIYKNFLRKILMTFLEEE